jgi:glycerophosphoryl diester phosphodiesterase
LRKAKELGCLWVEFDVRLTADRQLILLHDERLERTTDGRGKAILLPLAAIRSFDAGRRFGTQFRGESVPTLAEAVTVLGELGIGANIEIKAAHGREDETGTLVAAMIARLWPRQLPQPLISSFHQRGLAAARAHAPEIARGLLFRTLPKDWRALAESLACSTIHADHRYLSAPLVAEIQGAGYPVLAYTVNDPMRAHVLFGWGVTSVFSDVPHMLSGATRSNSAGAREGVVR